LSRPTVIIFIVIIMVKHVELLSGFSPTRELLLTATTADPSAAAAAS